MKQTDPKALEAAMPSLIKKLQELHKSLPVEERELFKGIIESATQHTQAIQMLDDDQSFVKLVYEKPMSVHATEKIRRDFLDLSKSFED